MTRTAAREIAARLCFALSANGYPAENVLDETLAPEYYETLVEEDAVFSVYPDEKQKAYICRLVKGIGQHNAELDGYIEKYAKGWSFGRISRTAVAVMKIAMYEILYMPEIPAGAAINEAVEIAKKYEEEETVPFVNGVLGGFVRGEVPAE